MSYSDPTSTPSPEEAPEFVSARARRRRALRRAYFPTDEAGRAELFTHLTRKAFPSYELYVFALLAGAILGLGYLFNTQALLVLGILVAPLLTPWVGTTLAVIAGAGRLFLQTLAALFVCCLIIFVGSAIAGFASQPFQPLTLNEAFIHSHLWPADLLALTLAAVLITIAFVRSESRPYLPSALLAYELFLPLGAAGFGLGSGLGEVWPAGLFVFFVHIAWATFFGLITLFILRFYPTSAGGFALTGLMFLVAIVIVISYTGFARWVGVRTGLIPPTPRPAAVIASTSTPSVVPSNTPSPRPVQTTAEVGVTMRTPSQTHQPTLTQVTLAPTETPTMTITAEPTPILAMIQAAEGGGAFIRERPQPGSTVLATLGNGSTVTIIPNDFQEVNGVIWVHVVASIEDRRIEGWIIQSVLQTATPIADWEPSPTP